MNARRFSANQSKKFLAKRRTRVILLSISAVVGASVFIFLLSSLTSLQILAIKDVNISGVESDQVASVRQAVTDLLQGKYLGLFSRANTFIFPNSAIKAKVALLVPGAENISLVHGGIHSIQITVNEKSPAALICTTLPDFEGNDLALNDPGTCFFADKTGFIYKQAPSFTGMVYNRYYAPSFTDSTSTPDIVGQYATSTEEFVRIQGVYESVKRNKIPVDAILLKAGGEYELYGRNPDKASSTVVIYFNNSSPISEQMSNLFSFWNHMLTNSQSKKEKLEFDYIDVRYGVNVFYRLIK